MILLDKNLSSDIFEKELAMCQELSKDNSRDVPRDGAAIFRGCNWGECEKCGVIPLLFKLGKGELYEGVEEVEGLKKKILDI